MITQVKTRWTVEETINAGNIYDLNHRDDGLSWNFEF